MESPLDIQKLNKNYNIDTTVEYAVRDFAKSDLAEMIGCCAFTPADGGFTLRFIDRTLNVTYPEGVVTYADDSAAVPDIVRILVLHHAVNAHRVPLSAHTISFKELPGGDIYIGPFTNRCIRYLCGVFGNNIAALKQAVARTEHREESFGDYSATIQVMPRVPVTLIVYEGDDEFPANANILFNGSAADLLPTEDYTQLSAFLIGALKKLAFA